MLGRLLLLLLFLSILPLQQAEVLIRKRVRMPHRGVVCRFILHHNQKLVNVKKSRVRCSRKHKKPIKITNFQIISKKPHCLFTLDMIIKRHGRGKLIGAEVACYSKPVRFDCDRVCSTSTPSICMFNLQLVSLKSDGDGYRADGRVRPILGFRRTNPGYQSTSMPGPPIIMCEGDILKLHFKNDLSEKMTNIDGSQDFTTLHFHGIREKTRPFADGVPFVSQCPILPGKSFLYGFDSSEDGAPPGNYWYHSHVGAQRTNGAYGALVIKEKKPIKWNGEDIVDDGEDIVDDSKNILVIQEWYKSGAEQVPVSVLINGKGRVAEQILSGSDADIFDYLKGTGHRFRYIPNTEFDGPDFSTNYEEFDVRQPGKMYRFRIISAISQNFPLCLSIEDHTFTAIATDSRKIKPVPELTDLCLASAERFDILVQTKENWRRGSPYKIKLFGRPNPSNTFHDFGPPLCTVAWLIYPGQEIDQSYVAPHDCENSENPPHPPPLQRILNPLPTYQIFSNRLKYPDWQQDTTKSGNIFLVDLRSKGQEEETKGLKNLAVDTKYFGFSGNLAFNRQRMVFPRVPFLLQQPQNNMNRCSQKPSAKKCQNVIEMPWYSDRSKWAEIVLINYDGYTAAHPIHQHGGWYRVVGMGSYDHKISRAFIIAEDKKGNIVRNLDDAPPAKDTLQIPLQGYAVLRVPLDNAGAWIFHCHINYHNERGMVAVQQIGKFKDWSIGNLKKNERCKVPPPSPFGGPTTIHWYLYMEPAVRTVKKGVAVTFSHFGHSVNVLSYTDWRDCYLGGKQVSPNADVAIDEKAGYGDYVFMTYEPGTYYLACGLGRDKKTNIGFHCQNGMKATIHVI